MAENETEFAIGGLESERDREAIDAELHEMEGVSGTEWNEERGELHVRFDYDILSAEDVKRAVREMGYAVDGEE